MTAAGFDSAVSASRWTILTSAEASLVKGALGSSEDDKESERERLTPMVQFAIGWRYCLGMKENSTLDRSAGVAFLIRLSFSIHRAAFTGEAAMREIVNCV